MSRRLARRGGDERRRGTTPLRRSSAFAFGASLIVALIAGSTGIASAAGGDGAVPPPLLLSAAPAPSVTAAGAVDPAPIVPDPVPLPSASGSGSATTSPTPDVSPSGSSSVTSSAEPTLDPSTTPTPTPTTTSTPTPTPTDCVAPSASATDGPAVDPSAAACPSPSPSDVVYAITPAVQKLMAVVDFPMTASAELTTNFPAVADSPVVFAISPDLPTGLSMDAATGVISGTPTVVQGATAYVVTADDGTHQAIATLGITVLDGPLIEPVSQTLKAPIGEPVTPTEAFTSLGFQASPVYFTNPALPSGLAIDYRTGVVSGTLSEPITETTFTVFGFDGTKSATATIEIAVECPTTVDGTDVLPDRCLRPIGDIGTGRHGVDPNLRNRTRAVYAKGDSDVHGPYSATTGSCASCHRTHAETRPTFVQNQTTNPRQVSALCFTCHDTSGTGSKYTVQAEYVAGGANVVTATSRQYYNHDAVSAVNTRHATATMSPTGTSTPVEEFAGVSNRHSECTDCHNPHSDSATLSVQSPLGTPWTPSGRMTGVSAVKVTYNATTQAPIYQFLDGVTNKATAEYQLCMKCHSSYTTLPSNTGYPESQWILDAAVEFNPAGKSMHPVEAAGKNQTTAMGLSLSGASTYKLWDSTTTQTIRCTQCHASSAMVFGQGGGQTAAPHSVVKNAASTNYSILTLPYSRSDAKGTFSEANFALCFSCHSNSPFIASSGTTINGASSPATNFNRHYLHVTSQGFTCQECHYRLHSTAYPATGGGTQTLDGGGLVSFPPSVTAGSQGPIKFTRTVGATNVTGTCTLTCHGEDHQNASFS